MPKRKLRENNILLYDNKTNWRFYNMKNFAKDAKNMGLAFVGAILGTTGLLIAAPASVITKIGVALMEGGHKCISSTIERPDPMNIVAEIADA